METPKDRMLQQLKDILLEEEREKQQALEQEIIFLRQQLNAEKLAEKVVPVFEEKIEALKNNMAELSGPIVTQAIKTQIRDHRDDMIDALYPIIGKLVKKFIQEELEKLSEEINKQIDATFSWGSIKREFMSLFGFKEKDLLLQKITSIPVIEEVYVVYQDSGLLIGHYSRNTTVDQDMIAGMLTAIKSFVEDAFQQKSGHLDMIQYGTFKILIHNAYKYYIVAVVSGVVDADTKSKLLDDLLLFGEKHLSTLGEFSEQQVSELLTKHFAHLHANR